MRQHQCERSWLNWRMSRVKGGGDEGYAKAWTYINLFAAFWLWHSLLSLLLFYILCITWTTTATRCSCHCVFHIPFPFPFPLLHWCLRVSLVAVLSVTLQTTECFSLISLLLFIYFCLCFGFVCLLQLKTHNAVTNTNGSMCMCVCVCLMLSKVSARLSQAAQLNAQCSRRDCSTDTAPAAADTDTNTNTSADTDTSYVCGV